MVWPWKRKEVAAVISVVPKGDKLPSALYKFDQKRTRTYTPRAPELMAGVLPPKTVSPIAMDSNLLAFPSANVSYGYAGAFAGFPGYPYLAMLATRAEYRAFASALSTELTREWITINSCETAGDSTKKKVSELTKAIEDIGLKSIIQRAAEHDCYFGRGQIFMGIGEQDRDTPLILSDKTIDKLGAKALKLSNVEPMWTTPAAYNAIDPAAPDFYKPTKWFMLGKEVHASRLLSVVTRPLPDMLKAAYNFSGMSLSQLAEPYVDNWLRTRQSVSDLINNFSVTALKTSMEAVLSGTDDGTDLFARAALFTATRSNQGLMLLDKDREEMVQQNVPLGGLEGLQAQAQEHMCSVSRMPAIILTGISPAGLNASSEGEIRTFYDWIAAQQESYWRTPIDTIFKVLQLLMYGEIDPDLSFSFVSLFQMTPKELAEIRTANSTTAGNLIDRGVIAPEEERERLARDPDSGYQGLDLSITIPLPTEGTDDDEDNKDDED